MYASDSILIGLGSFLVGSIPFGVLLAKLFKLPDPRGIGSGNIGATNMLRTGNKKVALLTLILDGLKGALPVLYAKSISTTMVFDTARAAVDGCGRAPTLENCHLLVTQPYPALALLMAVLGHCYSPWLKFKGGKGVATALGGILALSPGMGAGVCLVWLVVAKSTRYVSLASVTAGVAISVITLPFLDVASTALLAPVGLVILFKHRPNIQRLMAGTEPKIGAKKHA